MKKATFRDVQTLNLARAARTHHPDLQATKEIEGYRVQPMFPVSLGLLASRLLQGSAESGALAPQGERDRPDLPDRTQ